MSARKKPLLAMDLFSWAGGLTEGLKQAWFKVVSAVELVDVAAESYLMNHPEVSLQHGDIRTMDPSAIMSELWLAQGDLDLLAGCPPCQGFSTLRTRRKYVSVDDGRNDLVFEFLRFIEAFLPKTVMLENVPALAKDGRMDITIARLAELWYVVDGETVEVHDVSEYGVPQRRKRMILLASRKGKIPKTGKVAKKSTVRDFLGPLSVSPNPKDDLHDTSSEKRTDRVQTMISLIPKDGWSRSSLPEEYQLPCHKRYPNGFRDVYWRMKWDAVSPTITGWCTNPSKWRFIHPEFDRPITLREAALLQTFPKDYKLSLRKGKTAASLMIGNALPPEFIKVHAVSIAAHLDEHAEP